MDTYLIKTGHVIALIYGVMVHMMDELSIVFNPVLMPIS